MQARPPMPPGTPSSPHRDGRMHAIQIYFSTGSLGALIWDIIIHLSQDFQLATQYGINIPFIVYCISRISSLAYLLGVVVASTSAIGDCSMVQKISFIYPVAIPSTLLLFVFRVCALYHNSKSAVAFFSCLWIGLLACSIVMPFGISAYNIEFTGYCEETKKDFVYTLVDLSPFVHDTIIFLATSWAFISNSYEGVTLKNGFKVIFFGSFLPAFSKSILRDGQLYYLSILVLNIAVVIVSQLHTPWLPSSTFSFPLFVLTNTLAAHIYRNVRLKAYTDHMITSSVIDKNLRAAGAGIHGPSSNPNLNNPHGLNIVFQRSLTTSTIRTTTTTDTTETGVRRHSSHPIEGVNGIQGEVGTLDLEKQGDEAERSYQ